MAGLGLQGPGAVQRRLPHRPDRHARADRRTGSLEYKRRGVEPDPARLPALPGGRRVLRPRGAARSSASSRPRSWSGSDERRVRRWSRTARSASLEPGGRCPCSTPATAMSTAAALSAELAEGAVRARRRPDAAGGRARRAVGLGSARRSRCRRRTAAPTCRPESLAEVFRLLAAGDPSVAQIPHSHFVYVNALRHRGHPCPAVVLLRRGAGAASGSATPSPRSAPSTCATTAPRCARRARTGWALDGEKGYSTGALFADWIPVLAHLDDGRSDARRLGRRGAPTV